MRVGGIREEAIGYYLWQMRTASNKPGSPLIVVVPNQKLCESISQDISFFLTPHAGSPSPRDLGVFSFFSWDTLAFDSISPSLHVASARMETLLALLEQRAEVVVVSADTLLHKSISPSAFKSRMGELALGEPWLRDDLVRKLDGLGYQRHSLAEEPGQMSVRGAVVDFFPPNTLQPVRVELFGDVVDSLRHFDVSTQRSTQALTSIRLVPAREVLFPSTEGEREAAVRAIKQRASEIGIALSEVKPIEEAVLERTTWPGIEHLQPLFGDTVESFFQYVPKSSKVVVYNEHEVLETLEESIKRVNERHKRAIETGHLVPSVSSSYLSIENALEQLNSYQPVYVDTLQFFSAEESREDGDVRFFSNAKLRASLDASKHGDAPLEPLFQELKKLTQARMRVGIVVRSEHKAERMLELLRAHDIQASHEHRGFSVWEATGFDGGVKVLEGSLLQGFSAPRDGVVLISEDEIFLRPSNVRRSASARSLKRFLTTLSQLVENDYVVHLDHGIALYRGLRQIEIDGKPGDFLHLEYAEGAKLFVPVENIGKVQKYTSADATKVSLSRLGGKQWETVKKKVKDTVAELAGQLVNLYAEREVADGFSFGPLSEQDTAFALSFPYQETPDQEKAIEEVLSDMESSKPMDRLVCGDVGYGKTEVAIRAAYKAIHTGKQVAVLVPTTVLVDQHYKNFNERLSDFAVKTACVSRFYSPKDNKATLEAVRRGEVDVVIGTHRIIQKDVQFKDLGLVIIDEEHRFGVAHKERLKQFRSSVDVLSMTATPIPRTLHMSLVGIRDLSTIQTPPTDRQVIRTYIAEYDEPLVREALLREKQRNGQSFYIHNRVQGIELVVQELRDLVPEVTIDFAHGQMPERKLEEVMHRFASGEIDVLVATTIVESGLDIPNANTIVVRDTDRYGLAELYQLRGRVGRSSRRAYAYLLFADKKKLGVDAKKRLSVLQELDDLGVGFRLAIQDMEIRGAGNLLGKDQSGHVNQVGFELYSEILKDAISELKKREQRVKSTEEAKIELPRIEPEMQIGFPSHIPPFYIPDVRERLLLYQRLVQLSGVTEGQEIAEEIQDRFGRPPPDVEVLIESMIFRALLRVLGVISAQRRGDVIRLAFHPLVELSPENVIACIMQSSGSVSVSPQKVVSVRLQQETIKTPYDIQQIVIPVLKQLTA